MAAITMLVRLRLFPAVFRAPSPTAEALGDDYGAPCLAAMLAAHALLQVDSFTNTWKPPLTATPNLIPVSSCLMTFAYA